MENPFKFGTLVDSPYFTDRVKEQAYLSQYVNSPNHLGVQFFDLHKHLEYQAQLIRFCPTSIQEELFNAYFSQAHANTFTCLELITLLLFGGSVSLHTKGYDTNCTSYYG